MRIKLHCGRTVSSFLSFFSSSFRRIESLSSIMNYRLNNEVNETLTVIRIESKFFLCSGDRRIPRPVPSTPKGGTDGCVASVALAGASGVHDRFAKFSPEFPATGRAKTMVHRAGETGGRSERGAREREREREPGRAGTGVPTTIAYSVDEEGTIGRRARATGTVNAQNSAWCQ